jgi:hypothetical protein
VALTALARPGKEGVRVVRDAQSWVNEIDMGDMADAESIGSSIYGLLSSDLDPDLEGVDENMHGLLGDGSSSVYSRRTNESRASDRYKLAMAARMGPEDAVSKELYRHYGVLANPFAPSGMGIETGAVNDGNSVAGTTSIIGSDDTATEVLEDSASLTRVFNEKDRDIGMLPGSSEQTTTSEQTATSETSSEEFEAPKPKRRNTWHHAEKEKALIKQKEHPSEDEKAVLKQSKMPMSRGPSKEMKAIFHIAVLAAKYRARTLSLRIRAATSRPKVFKK